MNSLLEISDFILAAHGIVLKDDSLAIFL